MKILVLSRYGHQGASSRMRFFQYLPGLSRAGLECEVSPLLDDAMLQQRYRQGSYGFLALPGAYWRRIRILLRLERFDLVWVEKECLPWFPAWLERLLLRGKPYVLDFDDAIFHNYDLHRNALVRCIFGRRIDRLMQGAQLVVAGNRYLAERAIAAGARRVEMIPTVVDVGRYAPKMSYDEVQRPRIVWIGSPSTASYLLDLAAPLRALAERRPFRLRVIGSGPLSLPGIDLELLPWTADMEAQLITECDIGIMPLRDTPWERGKCAYKLIQYMACGLPVVASPVGANREVVEDGVNGFTADNADAWLDALECLLSDATLRQRLGQAGRRRVEETYSLLQTIPKLQELLTMAGARTCAV